MREATQGITLARFTTNGQQTNGWIIGQSQSNREGSATVGELSQEFRCGVDCSTHIKQDNRMMNSRDDNSNGCSGDAFKATDRQSRCGKDSTGVPNRDRSLGTLITY
ncbi:unannotated protein [freshwater metagenome]|uniref:Unannotated protein n=1 Tax=freshwater metagenome TaxID=449393 RepID=A0A6J6I988_9ZZZZ